MNTKETCYFFFDYDGTVFIKEQLSEQTVKALEHVQSLGHKIILHTGRSRAFFQYHNPNRDIIHWDGMIFGGTDFNYLGKRYHEQYIDPKDVLFFIDYICKKNFTMNIENEENYFPLNPKNYSGDHYSEEDIKAIKKEYLAMISEENHTTKVAIHKHGEWCIDKIPSKDIPEDIRVSIIRHDGYTEIFPYGRTKASGFKDFIRFFHIPLEQCAVFGDSNNDVDTFEACELSVGMQHSTEKLRKVATYITKESDGVAEGLQWLLNRK